MVTFQSLEGFDSVLEGFTITNGNGGVTCIGTSVSNPTSPTIRGNIITGNDGLRGGGVNCTYSGALIELNSITDNSAHSYGGGIHLDASHAIIRQNDI